VFTVYNSQVIDFVVNRLEEKKRENANRAEKGKALTIVFNHNHHLLFKRKKNEEPPSCPNLQWKRGGDMFTEKRHEKVNEQVKKAQKEACESQLHKVFTECERF
jgi:hypothetical protein